MQFLERNRGNVPGGKYIVKLLDDFLHTGPNGTHQCLVFELLGPSVDMVLQDYHISGDQLEPDTILRLSEQLLEGISAIHESGLGHGGRMTPIDLLSLY